MTEDTNAATRRIIDSIGEKRRMPVLGIQMIELYLVLGITFLGLVIGSYVPIPLLQWATIGLSVVGAILLVYASPSNMTTVKWLQVLYRYVKRPALTFAASENASSNDKNRGGLANKTPFTPDERTQDLTGIKRAWPDQGAILCDDGTMEAFLEIEAENMDFATAEDWASKQRVAQEFANKTLRYDIKFHATTESFDIEGVISRLNDRLSDPDIQQRAVLESLLTEYRDRRPAEMKERGTQQFRFFIGVKVTAAAVTQDNLDEKTPTDKLATLPVFGLLVSPFVTRSSDLDEQERYARMAERLDKRVTEIRNNFIQNVSGMSGRRLSTVELFALNARFWNGREDITAESVEGLLNSPVTERSERDAEGRMR